MNFIIGFILGALLIAYNPGIGDSVHQFSSDVVAYVKKAEIN